LNNQKQIINSLIFQSKQWRKHHINLNKKLIKILIMIC